MDKEDALELIMTDVSELLADLYQGGFDTVHESTTETLTKLTKRTAEYGMQQLSGLLLQLSDGLNARRHKLKKDEDNIAGIYTKLNMYVRICKGKIENDRGVSYYEGTTKGEMEG